jgi:hypothetical protein
VPQIIKVDFDTSVLDKTVKRYTKNLAYSTAQALNDTAKEAQKRIRVHMRDVFKIRKADFMDRSIKIFAFANVNANRPYAELGVDNKSRLLLSLFETGGTRSPFKGKTEAVPVIGQAARPSFEQPVTPSLTFQALNFQRAQVTGAGKAVLSARKAAKNRKRKLSGGYYVWQGSQRTFILPQTARHPFGGVFQRVGSKRDDIRMIYSFRQSVQVKKALDFVEITRSTFEDVFNDAFVRRFFRLT